MLTLWSETASDADLRRVGDEILHRLQEVPEHRRLYVVGGRPRQIRVHARRRAHGGARRCAAGDPACPARRRRQPARRGVCARNREFVVDSGPFIESAHELGNVVLAAPRGQPVYLRDVAEVIDGPEETTTYTRSASARRPGTCCTERSLKIDGRARAFRRSHWRSPSGTAPTRCTSPRD